MIDSERIKRAVTELLSAIGEDPTRAELLATPEKVAGAYAEFFKGVGVDETSVLSETFEAQSWSNSWHRARSFKKTSPPR